MQVAPKALHRHITELCVVSNRCDNIRQVEAHQPLQLQRQTQEPPSRQLPQT